MCAGDGFARRAVGLDQRGAQRRQAVAASQRADQRRVGPQRAADIVQRQRQVVDGVECADGEAQIESGDAEVVAVFLDPIAPASRREQRAGIDHFDMACIIAEPAGPIGRGAADQQRGCERPRHVANPFEAIVEGAVEQEFVAVVAGSAIAAQGAEAAVEQVAGHGGACAAATAARQGPR